MLLLSTWLSLLPLIAVRAQLVPSPTYNPPPAASGTQPSTSTPNAQWSTVMGNALWFYDAQRSGYLDQGAYPNRVAWRNNSALHDGYDWDLDLTGGFYDAGDYIKCTYPLGFTLFGLSWGALTHGKGYDQAEQTAYLDSTLRWGYDWTIKAHPSDDVLFLQVGDTVIDNDYWGGDQGIPTDRPSYPINSTHPGQDAWSSTAAAFAMGAMLYNPNITYNSTSAASPPASIANETYSAELLSHAVTLYRVANQTLPYTLFATSVPAIASAYASSQWGDKMAIAALTLALATDDSKYYYDAYQQYQTYALTGCQRPFNWDSRTPGLYVLWVEAALARPNLAIGAGLDVNLTGWQYEAESYFDRLLDAKHDGFFMTPGGLLYWNGDSAEASLNPATACAMLMFKYAPMASTTEKANTYRAFAQSQLDYMLGKNPMNAVYLVGSHPNSPVDCSSAPASGGSGFANMRYDPPVNLHVLYGGMVGGPLANDRFWDWRDDWVQTEVALDYNAMIPTLAAMQILNGSSDPFYVTVQAGTYSIPSGQPCDDALPCPALSHGDIAGIVIGVIIGLILIFGFIGYCYKRNKFCFRKFKYRKTAPAPPAEFAMETKSEEI